MKMAAVRFLLILLSLVWIPSSATGKVIASDTVWTGEVNLSEDILIPEGITLSIMPGTIIKVAPPESAKTDPEFISPLTEITVRGTLAVNGKEAAPVTFVVAAEKKASWAGIIIDGGKAVIRSAIISNADAGVYVLRGSLSMDGSLLTKNHYGITVQGQDAFVRITKTQVKENDYGLLLLDGAKADVADTAVQGNKKKDKHSSAARELRLAIRDYKAEKKETSRIYKDEVMLGTTVWQNRVEVNGIIRVPQNSRLIILPGTVVEFIKKDTNNDGIGEHGLLIQGVIIAKGTSEDPIIFRSAEKQKRMGDWDAINIMNSDTAQNLIEYCQIQDAYRGLHFHFSNVAVINSVLKNNYRGMQFQESLGLISGTHFYENKSAFQARDSEIIFSGNAVYRNYSGINTFRNSIALSGSLIVNNYLEGLRVREGLPTVERNLIDANRHGLMVNDVFYGTFGSNVISHNAESGILLKSAEGIEVIGNVIQANGINGISIQDASAFIKGNFISDNGERGIGILSFFGVITENNILKNRLYNLGIDGKEDVSARMNWWGYGDIKNTIYDKDKDPSKGKADYLPMMKKPAGFTWPLQTIQTDTTWHGDIIINGNVVVSAGANLVISPNTKVLFSKSAGLKIKGKISAIGEKNAGISFTSVQGPGAGEWDEIMLDHAAGSVFSNCLLENATWALHSHFTDLKVKGCSFMNNTGGLRFTSGPIEVRRSIFRGNAIGIRAFRGTALITENVITGNKIGVFVREKGGGLTITKNNLFDNGEYNIRIGDFNDEDISARDNWWGDTNPADTVFDARKEPGIGKVLYEPYSKAPFKIELPTFLSDEKKMKIEKKQDGDEVK